MKASRRWLLLNRAFDAAAPPVPHEFRSGYLAGALCASGQVQIGESVSKESRETVVAGAALLRAIEALNASDCFAMPASLMGPALEYLRALDSLLVDEPDGESPMAGRETLS